MTNSAQQPDPYGLARFVEAQDPVISAVRHELKVGSKQSHWMWFVFPQIAGLGRSPTARRFAISSGAEAAAYLAHPVLGQRLEECTSLTLAHQGKSAEEIFGWPDWMKFRSSMTLFSQVAGGNDLFERALKMYFAGQPDAKTLRLLASPRED